MLAGLNAEGLRLLEQASRPRRIDCFEAVLALSPATGRLMELLAGSGRSWTHAGQPRRNRRG